MAVNQRIAVFLGQRLARGKHVVVHPLHPRHEAVEVSRPARLTHAMDTHASRFIVASLLAVGHADRASEHVDEGALADQRLGKLAHMPREPPLDHRGVLPREDQDAVAHEGDPISRESPARRSRSSSGKQARQGTC
jgi:hypothetical protein